MRRLGQGALRERISEITSGQVARWGAAGGHFCGGDLRDGQLSRGMRRGGGELEFQEVGLLVGELRSGESLLVAEFGTGAAGGRDAVELVLELAG